MKNSSSKIKHIIFCFFLLNFFLMGASRVVHRGPKTCWLNYLFEFFLNQFTRVDLVLREAKPFL